MTFPCGEGAQEKKKGAFLSQERNQNIYEKT